MFKRLIRWWRGKPAIEKRSADPEVMTGEARALLTEYVLARRQDGAITLDGAIAFVRGAGRVISEMEALSHYRGLAVAIPSLRPALSRIVDASRLPQQPNNAPWSVSHRR